MIRPVEPEAEIPSPMLPRPVDRPADSVEDVTLVPGASIVIEVTPPPLFAWIRSSRNHFARKRRTVRPREIDSRPRVAGDGRARDLAARRGRRCEVDPVTRCCPITMDPADRRAEPN